MAHDQPPGSAPVSYMDNMLISSVSCNHQYIMKSNIMFNFVMKNEEKRPETCVCVKSKTNTG